MTTRFVVGTACLRGDCACRALHGAIGDDRLLPPLHPDCDCYLETVPRGLPADVQARVHPAFRALRVELDARGFLYRRRVGDRLIGVLPLLHGQARLGIGPIDALGFNDVWDYPGVARAVAAATSWDPETTPEPDGWHRHLRSGRRREDGDPLRERRTDD